MLGATKAGDGVLLGSGIGLIVAVLTTLVLVDGRAPTGPGSAVAVAAVLLVGSLPIIWVVARRDGDESLGTFLILALTAKLAGAFARFYLTSAAYGGFADAARYDAAGREWVEGFHDGRAVWVVDSLSNFSPGTQATGTITGLVYAAAGRNMLTGFVVFSWLGFWGLTMAYRAFRVGLPDGDHRRYRLLLFFLPSLVFWPSSIGKDAWMQLSLGAVFLGVALLTASRPRWSGAAWLAGGLAGAALLRPHIALAALAPLAVALAIRTTATAPGTRSRGGPVRVFGLAVLAVASILLLNRLGAVFGGDDPASSVTGVLDTASEITAQGGSEFEASEVSSIADLPMATIAVLFRPFIWEANSAVRAIASLETTLLFLLTVASWPRLRTLPRRLRESRYLVYVTIFAVVSIVGFSHVGNEGILARQRTQFLPAVLVLLCVPSSKSAQRSSSRRTEPPGALSGSLLGTDTVPGRGSLMTPRVNPPLRPPSTARDGGQAIGSSRPVDSS